MVDTLKIYERFKKAGISDKAAKELAEIFKEIFDKPTATKKTAAVVKPEKCRSESKTVS